MPIALEAIVGDLHVVGGVRQPMTLPTAAFHPPRRVARGRAGDRLFVLLELHPPDRGTQLEVANAPYNKIIDQVAASYWHTEGSVTAALRQAIQAAGNWLMDYNLEAPVRERFRAGITCVAMREADVFVAQAGPGACYVAHQGQIERFPNREVVVTALGASRSAEVRYSHAELHPGDVVLMLDSGTAERVADQAIAEAIVYVGVPAALTRLEQLAGAGDLLALLIEGAAAGAPAQPARERPATAPAGEPVEPPRPSPRPPRARQPILPAGPALPRQDLADRARQVVRAILLGAIIVSDGVKGLFQGLLPEPAADERRAASGLPLVQAGLAIIIPLLVAALVFYLYTQRRQQVEFQSLLNTAQASLARAQVTPEDKAARLEWQQTWQHATQALSYRPGHADARAMRDQALAQLDRIDRVTRLKATLLFDFGPGATCRLAGHSANLFIMDAQRLWHLTLDQTGTGILEKQAPPLSASADAAAGERQIGPLLDLAWVSADGLRTKSSLLILKTGGLLEYDPAWNIRPVPLGQEGTEPAPRLMAAFGGNLYILGDTQLWRYKPMGDGFGTAPGEYFNTPPGDLGAVIDMAIDGNIYLLYADGRIRKFFGGDEQPFGFIDMPDPPIRPVGVAADAQSARGALYLADTGGARVMHFTSQGIFVRQLKTADGAMDALQDLVVDERAQRIFFLSGGKLYAAPLPALRAP